MTENAVLPQKVADTKTVVLKDRFDSRMARLKGEQLKRDFFKSYGLLKPKPEDIQLLGFEKYYEPYLVIGGLYSVDYCRQHICSVNVGENTEEIYVGAKKFKSESSEAGNHSSRVVKLMGEEVTHHEKNTYFVLDRFRREISPLTFTFAPYEDKPYQENTQNATNYRKFETSIEADIDFLKSKIAKRPPDVAAVMREIFEITERMIVYKPVYELTFQDLRTSKEATLQIDGVNGKMVLIKYHKRNTDVSLRRQTASLYQDFSTDQSASRESESELTTNTSPDELKETAQNSLEVSTPSPRQDNPPCGNDEIPDFPADIKGEVFTVGDNVTAIVGNLEIPPGTTVSELLVVKGTLRIGDKCRMSRKLKVLGDVMVGSETVIEDSLISGGNVVIGAGTVIHGSIKAAGRIEFKEKVFEEKDTRDSSVDSKEIELEVVVEPAQNESGISCRD